MVRITVASVTGQHAVTEQGEANIMQSSPQYNMLYINFFAYCREPLSFVWALPAYPVLRYDSLSAYISGPVSPNKT